MKSRFRYTRKHKLKKQRGGAKQQVRGLQILDINAIINAETIVGRMPEFSIEDILSKGTLFNGSVLHRVINGHPFLLGTLRFHLVEYEHRFPEDTRTRTTIQTRDALSNNSNWVTGWEGPDFPIFYAYQLDTQTIKFFFMNILVKKFGFDEIDHEKILLEDPRICIDATETTMLFYAHRNTEIRPIFDRVGEDLDPADGPRVLNGGQKPRLAALTKLDPQFPYVSSCRVADLDQLLSYHFFGIGPQPASNRIPNTNWKLLCSNLMGGNQEKNWVIIPQRVGEANVFTFIRSFGLFTKSVIAYFYPVASLTVSTDDNSTKCMYGQSIGGITKQPGQPHQVQEELRLANNNKISVLHNYLKKWISALLKLFVGKYIDREDVDYTFPGTDLRVKKFRENGALMVEIQYPYKYRNGQDTKHKYEWAKLNDLKIDYTGGISTGGPGSRVLGGGVPATTMVFAGHFKPKHHALYFLIASALLFQSDPTFRDYAARQIAAAEGSYVQMGDAEKAAFLNFVEYLVTSNNIFYYIYSLIQKTQPFNPQYDSDLLNALPGSYKNLQTTHHELFYTTFFFKMNVSNYELLTISQQFFFDNQPKDCKGPSLQFTCTIASNNRDTYYIPYGNNDVQSRVAIFSREAFDGILRNEKNLRGIQPDDNHAYYLDLIKSFLSLTLLQPEGAAE